MRRIKGLAAAQRFFEQRVIEQINELGPRPDEWYTGILDTVVGPLRIRATDFGVVFTSFVDVDRLKANPPCGVRDFNPCSGKWNWHYPADPALLRGGCEKHLFDILREITKVYVIKSDYGWVRHFDGEDYLWTNDIAKACKFNRMESAIHFNRLIHLPGVVVINTENNEVVR